MSSYPYDPLFDRLRDAIDGGNRHDMRMRELRACAGLLEMHVAEETPDPDVFDAVHSLVIQLAVLRRVSPERRAQVDAALLEIRNLAFS